MIATVNIERTYTELCNGGRALLWTGRGWQLTDGPAVYRWIGRCKHCKRGGKLEGRIVQARRDATSATLIDAGGVYYLAGCNGTDSSSVTVKCSCGGWVGLARVTEGRKHSKHECNARCLASTGPNCDCRCKGANHGSSL